jgi:hypothetical protein
MWFDVCNLEGMFLALAAWNVCRCCERKKHWRSGWSVYILLGPPRCESSALLDLEPLAYEWW